MVSMKEIAQRLNLSRCTVSNILNNKLDGKSYKKETIQLVLNTANEMGYISNNIAKSLKTGVTGTIAIIVPDIANTFYIKIIKEIERLANNADYSLIICMAEERLEKENRALKMLHSRMVDGVLISPVSYSESLLEKYPFPIICFDRTVSNETFPSVLINNESAAEQLTNQLIGESENPPLFLAGSPNDYTVSCRLVGYKKALAARGIKFRKENIIYGIYDNESAYKKLCSLIQSRHLEFDSVFLSTNYFVYGVIRALRKNGLELRSIGGFENFNGSDLLDIDVIIVNQPEIQIANTSFFMLIERMQGLEVSNSNIIATIGGKQ